MDTKKQILSTKVTSFRFASGHILELNDQLINQIPYLAALTSFAHYSPTAFDQDGKIKLDPNIDFNHFRIIINALPFRSAHELLRRLPKSEDFAEMMLLIDYLGLLPTPHPTLADIDSMFLFMLKNHRRPLMLDARVLDMDLIPIMAAHFAFGLVTNEYDRTDDQVVSQIQWCSMFIFSAYEMFNPSVRWYVYKAARYYFLQPSLGCSNSVSRALTRITKSLFCNLGDQLTLAPNFTSSFNYVKLFPIPFSRTRYFRCGFDYEFFEWPLRDDSDFSDEENFVNKVSKRLFNSLTNDFWSKFVHDGCRIDPHIRRTAPSLTRIRELKMMDDYVMKRVVLQKMFEDLAIKTNIRKNVTEEMPGYIRDLEQKCKVQIDYLRLRLDNPGEFFGFTLSWLRTTTFEDSWSSEKIREKILLWEKKLEESRHVDQVIDVLCDLVLNKLYQLVIENVREMIEVQFALEDLKEIEEGQKKNIDDRRLVIVKQGGKSQKHRYHQSLPKLQMRKHQPKKLFPSRF